MLASLLAGSFQAFVIADGMLGSVLRAIRGIEVTDETLSFGSMRAAVEGPGHYLGAEQTLSLMETEFVYPKLGDRSNTDQWEAAGGRDIRARAREKVRDILSSHYPVYIEPAIDEELRRRFPVVFPASDMKTGCGRW